MLLVNIWTALYSDSHLCYNTTALSWKWQDDFKCISENHGSVKHCNQHKAIEKATVCISRSVTTAKSRWKTERDQLASEQLHRGLQPQHLQSRSIARLLSVLLNRWAMRHGINKGARNTLFSLALWKLQCTKIKLLIYSLHILENWQEQITSRKINDPDALLLNHDSPWELNQGHCYLLLRENALISDRRITVKRWQQERKETRWPFCSPQEHVKPGDLQDSQIPSPK